VGAPDKDVTITTEQETDAGTVYILVFDDGDGDGSTDLGDCDAHNSAVWAIPGEAGDVALSHSQGGGTTMITWSAPIEAGATSSSLRYDTLRSASPSNFTAAGVCLETDGTDLGTVDSESPPAGTAYFYLVRVENSCGLGSTGTAAFGSRPPKPAPDIDFPSNRLRSGLFGPVIAQQQAFVLPSPAGHSTSDPPIRNLLAGFPAPLRLRG
jgi:hypothetical protein